MRATERSSSSSLVRGLMVHMRNTVRPRSTVVLGAKEATITTRLHRARNQVAQRLAQAPVGKETGTGGVV